MSEPVYEQLPLGIRPRVGYTFSRFVTGGNALIVDMLKTMAAGSGEQQLLLWSGRGGGKSHLLQASCNEAAAAGRTSCYLPAEELRYAPRSSLDGLELVDLVCIDNVDVLAEPGDWDEALFHLVNRLRQSGSRLVLSACCAPEKMAVRLPDLRSRLGWGPVFQLQELDDEGKMRALQRRAQDYGLELGTPVAAYMLRHYPRNLFALFEHLERLDRASMAEQRRLTIPFIKSVLRHGAGDAKRG